MALSGDLGSLFTSDLPEGRQNLLDSYTNLERVAEYCENNYFQCDNKRAALEETKGYTTQSLASVAYQINTLAYNFLQMMDLQAAQLAEMESQVNHISQTVDIHREKVARREIGVLTTNKSSNRQYKIIAPANPERAAKYVRKPIDYSILDDIGHGVKLAPPQQVTPRQKRPSTSSGGYAPGLMGTSQYAPGGSGGSGPSSAYGSLGNVSGPAPTTKPPTPPQAVRYSSGTLNRNKDYRTPPVVAPPQVPSNYAPNYPQQQQRKQQYGTLPHPQVQMVNPMTHDDMRYMSGGGAGGATMPRLSSNSIRSSGSHSSSSGEPQYGMMRSGGRQSMSGQYGVLGNRQNVLQQSAPNNARPLSSQYAPGSAGVMSRPTQRPPSPPLPLPPPPEQQHNPTYSRQASTVSTANSNDPYSRQPSVSSSLQQVDTSSIYSRQPSNTSLQQQQVQLARQNSAAQLAAAAAARQLSRQSSRGSSGVLPQDSSLPGWVPKNYMEKVTAIYDYNADKEDELSFTEGAVIYVLKKNDDGWWEGVMDGITGLFPGNYVEASV